MVTGSLGRWVTKCDPVPSLVATSFLLVLSTELMCVAGRRRLVAQPGGLMLPFAQCRINTSAIDAAALGPLKK